MVCALIVIIRHWLSRNLSLIFILLVSDETLMYSDNFGGCRQSVHWLRVYHWKKFLRWFLIDIRFHIEWRQSRLLNQILVLTLIDNRVLAIVVQVSEWTLWAFLTWKYLTTIFHRHVVLFVLSYDLVADCSNRRGISFICQTWHGRCIYLWFITKISRWCSHVS